MGKQSNATEKEIAAVQACDAAHDRIDELKATLEAERRHSSQLATRLLEYEPDSKWAEVVRG